MKAKRKPLEIKTPEDFGIRIENRLKIIETVAPADRSAGVKVETVDALIEKLKDEVGVI
jgi:electron transfer flavoprotein beta subunit